jgi:ammonia channel protein AmtB
VTPLGERYEEIKLIFICCAEFVDLMGDRGFEVGWQIAGALTCFTWAAGTAAIILFFLLLLGKLRYPELEFFNNLWGLGTE